MANHIGRVSCSNVLRATEQIGHSADKCAPTRRDIGPTAIFAVANGDGCGHSGDKWNIFRQLLDFDPDGNALRKPDPGIDGIDIWQYLRAWGRIPRCYTPCDRFEPGLGPERDSP